MKLFVLTALAALLAPAAQMQEAVTLTPTELRQQPDIKAGLVASLAAGTAVKVGERRGAWYAAESGEKAGWLRMLSVRFGSGKAVAGDSGLKNVIGIAAGNRPTPATGVRGLNRDMVKAANANFAELAQLDNFRVEAEDARRFAAAGNVHAAGK